MKNEIWTKIRDSFLIFIASVVVGVLVPGLFASHDQVFFSDQMERTFKANDIIHTNSTDTETNSYSPRIERYIHDSEDLSNQLATVKIKVWDLLTNNAAGALTNALNASTTNLALADLVALRSKLEQDIAKRKEVLIPFYTSDQSLLWLDTFFTLGMLAIVFRPRTKPDAANKQSNPPQESCPFARRVKAFWWIPLVALLLMLFYKWPSLARGHIFQRDTDRLVLYYNAWRMGPWSASNIFDYILEWIYCILMIVIWRQWIQYAEEEDEIQKSNGTDESGGKKHFDTVLDPKTSKRILKMFVHWIIASLLLGTSFIFDAFFYYGAIADEGDRRYTISALLEMTVWGVSWLIISWPLIRAWSHWNELRAEAVREINPGDSNGQHQSADEIEAKLKLLEEAKPLSTAVVVAAQIGAVVSFVGTLIEQVFK